MMREARAAGSFLFIGNHLCLDFINTQMIVRGRLTDLLEGFSDLVAWLAQARVLDQAEARDGMRKWDDQKEGRAAFGQALVFRTTLRGMVERIVEGKPVPQSAVDAINGLLEKRVGHAQLVRVRGGFERRFHSHEKDAIHLLTPIAESAGDLLCRADFSLIKKCQNPDCVLYFYDTTKNHARHWCSMGICGNRMKAAAHYRRIRARRV